MRNVCEAKGTQATGQSLKDIEPPSPRPDATRRDATEAKPMSQRQGSRHATWQVALSTPTTNATIQHVHRIGMQNIKVYICETYKKTKFLHLLKALETNYRVRKL